MKKLFTTLSLFALLIIPSTIANAACPCGCGLYSAPKAVSSCNTCNTCNSCASCVALPKRTCAKYYYIYPCVTGAAAPCGCGCGCPTQKYFYYVPGQSFSFSNEGIPVRRGCGCK